MLEKKDFVQMCGLYVQMCGSYVQMCGLYVQMCGLYVQISLSLNQSGGGVRKTSAGKAIFPPAHSFLYFCNY